MAVGFLPTPEERTRLEQIQQEEAANEIMNAAAAAATKAEPPKKGTFATETDLPPEMYQNIFEYCGWNILQNFLEASPYLKDVASDYIKHEMKTNTISVQLLPTKLKITPKCKFTPYIFEFVRDVTVYSGGNLEIFQYNGLFQNVQKMTFKHLSSSQPAEIVIDDHLRKRLEKLKAIEFCTHQFECKEYDRLLMHSRNNIKCLLIVTNSRTTNPSAYKSWWYFLEYPKLETIQWDQGYSNAQDKLKILLDKNPTIKNHRITKNIPVAIAFIKTNEINIEKLSLRFCDAPRFESICGEINSLYRKGQYKELHLTFAKSWNFKNTIHLIGSLHALRAITYDGDYVEAFGKLVQLKELYINSIFNRKRFEAAKQLQQLQRLYIKEATIDAIRPFINQSPNLTEIIVERLTRTTLMSVNKFIEERQQLSNAKTQKLFLGEWAYIRLKQHSNQPKILEIRRFESFQMDYWWDCVHSIIQPAADDIN